LVALGNELPDEVRGVVAAAWRFRYEIEVESELRFAALARRLETAGLPNDLVRRARVASADEHRHAAECAEYVKAYGAPVLPPSPNQAREFAPAGLDDAQRLTYEVVATCCIAETNSATNLVTLFNARPPEPLRSTLQTLSADEVTHGQLGWAYLELARARQRLDFLTPLVPEMLGTGDRLFEAGPPEEEDPRLLRHGVLPRSQRRELFLSALEEVIFPGFERVGVSMADARAWLAEARARFS
jgi:hypothetical protein